MTEEVREEKIRCFISDMSDKDFVELYNVYAEHNNYEKAYTTEEALELFPIEEGKTVQDVIYEWSSVLTESGTPKYTYIIYGVYGWGEFKKEDYEDDVLTDIDNILPKNLPISVRNFIDELDDEEGDDEED